MFSKAINTDNIKKKSMTNRQWTAHCKKKEKQKIKEWMKFLKDDGDFDYDSILRMFKYKIERTRKCILENNLVLDAKAIAAEMQEVEIILQRVIEDNYEDKYRKILDEKYGKQDFSYKKLERGNTQLLTRRSGQTPENTEQIRKESIAGYKQAYKDRKQDLAKAFRIITDKIWGWWD